MLELRDVHAAYGTVPVLQWLAQERGFEGPTHRA